MPDMGHGFQRAIWTLIGGLMISLIIRGVLESLDLGPQAVLISVLVYALSIFSLVVLSGKMKYWGFMYTIGWLFGLAIMLYALSSMISPIEIFLYIVITIIALAIKLSNKI